MNIISSSVLSVFLLQLGVFTTTVTAWDGDTAPASMSDSWSINPELVAETGAVNMTSDEQGFAPFMEYDKNYGFDFTYNVTNFIQPDQGSMAIYTTGCRSGGGKLIDTDADTITGLNADGTTLGKNLGFKLNQVVTDTTNFLSLPVGDPVTIRPVSEITWKVTLDPLNFADNADIFAKENEKVSSISFCLIFSLKTVGRTTEVNFQETEMVLNVDLQDPDASFNLGIDLAAKGKTSTADSVSYTPTAYVCTATDGSALAKSFVQGEVIDICIKPDEASQLQGGDGLRMNDISELKFELLGNAAVAQTAIPMSQSFGLAEHNQETCVDATYCAVSTVLLANFFADSGQVKVNGLASLKFAGGVSRQRRRLNEGHRSLQGDTGAVQATSPVDTIVGVTQSDDGPSITMMAAGGNTVSTTSSTIIVMMGSALMTMIATTTLWI